jgi:hypothetical protein
VVITFPLHGKGPAFEPRHELAVDTCVNYPFALVSFSRSCSGERGIVSLIFGSTGYKLRIQCRLHGLVTGSHLRLSAWLYLLNWLRYRFSLEKHIDMKCELVLHSCVPHLTLCNYAIGSKRQMLIVSNGDVFHPSRKTWLDYSMSMQTTDDCVTYPCSDMKVKWILGNNSTVYVGVHSIDTYITYTCMHIHIARALPKGSGWGRIMIDGDWRSIFTHNWSGNVDLDDVHFLCLQWCTCVQSESVQWHLSIPRTIHIIFP